jgi:pimeloyl-ACP methyl ester carboxylesterase
VRRSEEANGQFLLLVHGGASNHTRWSEFTDQTRLAAGWHLVSPDMRGNGESMTRGRQDIELWCEDLIDILNAENAPAAIIAGHSLCSGARYEAGNACCSMAAGWSKASLR